MTMTFSVVIPAYNAEKYISEAVSSVLQQLHSDWELIIINDGSRDKTREICEAYCAKDSRIRLINKENAGVSAARNDGIKNATGDYLFFLDADDMLGENVMQLIADKLDRLDYLPDIVFGEYDRFDEHSGVRKHYAFGFGSDLSSVRGKEIWRVLFSGQPVFVSPIMTQVYRTRFLQDNHIFFDTTLAYAEDHDWRFLALTYSERYYFTYFTYYYRESNVLSAMHAPVSYKRYASDNRFCTKWFRRAQEDPNLSCVRSIILERVAEIYISAAMQISLIQNRQERNAAWKLFRENEVVMRLARARRYRFVLRLYSVFGIIAIKLISRLYCSR